MPTIDDSMKGKLCMITGATSGIGLVTARALAQMGAEVIVVGRSEEKARATIAHIKEETDSENVSYLLADLSSQADVRRLASQFLDHHDRLDVLVNNAGAWYLRRTLSIDNIEMTFALNHLAYFLLTNLLLDALKKAAPSRIVNVSSNAHEGGRMRFDDLQLSKNYGGMRAYSQSKLANLLFTYELARRLEGTGVTVNAVHPGVVATNIGRNNGFIGKLVMPILSLFLLTAEEGAQTNIYGASSPDMDGVTGKYLYESAIVDSKPQSHDREAQRRLWEISAEMVGL